MVRTEASTEGGQNRQAAAPTGKRPTIEMVAARAGVSRQTVSNAANAPNRLRPETLNKVLGAIEEMGYRPSQAARSLRTDATRVLGCRLLPSNYGGTGGVLDRLFHSLCDAARSSGYDILTFSAATDDDEIAVYDDLLRRRAVDGFVLTNTHHVDARPAWLLAQRGPGSWPSAGHGASNGPAIPGSTSMGQQVLVKQFATWPVSGTPGSPSLDCPKSVESAMTAIWAGRRRCKGYAFRRGAWSPGPPTASLPARHSPTSCSTGHDLQRPSSA